MEIGDGPELLENPVVLQHTPEKASEGVLTIENAPPYFDELKHMLNVPVETVMKESKAFEKQYLAWQSVRHAGQGNELTGFEPYLLGNGGKIPELVLSLGTNSLKSLDRNPQLKQQVIQTLTGTRLHIPALVWLSSELGSITAKLRAQVSLHPEANKFRTDIYSKIAEGLGTINYSSPNGKDTKQKYTIPHLKAPDDLKLERTSTQTTSISPVQYLHLIGKVGHPLVRASLRHMDTNSVIYR